MKADLTKLSIKQRISYQLLKLIEPRYLALRDSIQAELNRIANLEAIAAGTILREKFRKGKPDGTKDALEIHRIMSGRNLGNCRHTKGGRIGTVRDYAVYLHTFPDGSKRIKCTLCPKAWFPKDADWNDAMKMVESSTNTLSSSEVVLTQERK